MRSNFSPVYAPSNEVPKSRSWPRSATTSTRPTAMASTVVAVRGTAAGRKTSSSRGSGREPMTLSTTIFSGSGVSSATGGDSRLSANMVASKNQQDRTCCQSRQYNVRGLKLAENLTPLFYVDFFFSLDFSDCCQESCRSGGTFLDHTFNDQKGRCAQQHTSRPDCLPARRVGKAGQERSQQGGRQRATRPGPDAQQLPATAVVFGRQKQMRRAKDAAAGFEVPVVAVSTTHRHPTPLAQVLLDVLQPLFDPGGSLGPDVRRPGPRHGVTGRRPAPPKCQPVTHAANQPRQRLQQVQKAGQGAPLPQFGAGGHLKGSPKGAPTGLHQERSDGQNQKRPRPMQRSPRKAQPRQERQRRDDQIPFGHHRQRLRQVRRRFVERLKRGGAPLAMIDAPHPPAQVGQTVGINPSGPQGMAGGIVFLGPLAFQHGLGLAVAALLLPVGQHRIAPVMPNEGRGAEPQSPPFLLQTPADIDVIARNVELRIEPADGFEGHFAKGHVTPGNMFGFL